MGQLVADAEVEVAAVEVELTKAVLDGRTLLRDDVTGILEVRVLFTKPIAEAEVDDGQGLEGGALLIEADWHTGQGVVAEDSALLMAD